MSRFGTLYQNETMRNRAGIEPCAFDFEMHYIINNDSILLQIFFKESKDTLNFLEDT